MAPEGEGATAQGESEETFGDGEDWDAPGEPGDLSALSAQTEWLNQQSMVSGRCAEPVHVWPPCNLVSSLHAFAEDPRESKRVFSESCRGFRIFFFQSAQLGHQTANRLPSLVMVELGGRRGCPAFNPGRLLWLDCSLQCELTQRLRGCRMAL